METAAAFEASYRSSAGHLEEAERVNVLGTPVDALNMESAISRLAIQLERGPKGYVCAVGVHGILEGLRNPVVAEALADASINIPDGTPTVWIGRLLGHRAMDHVTGPAIMHQMFSRLVFAQYSHFFYGGRSGVAEHLAATLSRQFPWTKIAGTYTPPFRDLSDSEQSELISGINQVRPDIIWVGIGTPRQDLFMQRILPYLDTRMMFGVGAAFDFLSGRIRDCPNWVKRSGFHWLHRLIQDPKRLWRRNLCNTEFLWHIALQLTGIRNYPLRSQDNRAS